MAIRYFQWTINLHEADLGAYHQSFITKYFITKPSLLVYSTAHLWNSSQQEFSFKPYRKDRRRRVYDDYGGGGGCVVDWLA